MRPTATGATGATGTTGTTGALRARLAQGCDGAVVICGELSRKLTPCSCGAPTTDTPAQGALVYPADWGVRITSWLATVNAPRLRCRVSPQDSSSGSLDLQHDTLPGCQTDQGDARTSATVLPHMGAAARVMEPATPPTMKTASTANSAPRRSSECTAPWSSPWAPTSWARQPARVQIRAALDRGIRALQPARSVTGCQVVNIGQFDHPAGLQRYAGSAPVTRRSGKSDFVVARRLAHNHYLGAAVHQWAFCSLTRSGWAREFYDGKIAAGKSHHAALRALSNRWLEFLWHCLTKRALRRSRARRQPQPGPRPRRLTPRLTEGVSRAHALRLPSLTLKDQCGGAGRLRCPARSASLCLRPGRGRAARRPAHRPKRGVMPESRLLGELRTLVPGYELLTGPAGSRVRSSTHEPDLGEIGRGHSLLGRDAFERLGQLQRQLDCHLGQPVGAPAR